GPEVRQEALDVPGGVAALGVGPERRDERPGEPLQPRGDAPQQARADLGVVEQLVQPDAEPPLHRPLPRANADRRGVLYATAYDRSGTGYSRIRPKKTNGG